MKILVNPDVQEIDPTLCKSFSMASFELISKVGDGSSDSALWLKVGQLNQMNP